MLRTTSPVGGIKLSFKVQSVVILRYLPTRSVTTTRGLHEITRGYSVLQGIGRGYNGLQGIKKVTKGYKGLQGVTGGLQEVIGG